MTKLFTPNRHTGGGRYPDAFKIPGFRVALAIASLPGMTIELYCEFLSHHTTPSPLPHQRHALRELVLDDGPDLVLDL